MNLYIKRYFQFLLLALLMLKVVDFAFNSHYFHNDCSVSCVLDSDVENSLGDNLEKETGETEIDHFLQLGSQPTTNNLESNCKFTVTTQLNTRYLEYDTPPPELT